jgi:hypothetical protein
VDVVLSLRTTPAPLHVASAGFNEAAPRVEVLPSGSLCSGVVWESARTTDGGEQDLLKDNGLLIVRLARVVAALLVIQQRLLKATMYCWSSSLSSCSSPAQGTGPPPKGRTP